jgi:hypothetical protein
MGVKMRVRYGLTSLVLLLFIVVAVPVWAYSSSVEEQRVIPAFSVRTVTANCPPGQHVTLGGIGAPLTVPLLSPGPSVFPQQMFMNSTQTKWTVVAINAGDAGVMASRVYCGVHPPRTVVARTVQVGAFSANGAFARCPEGQVVLAGGYRVPARLEVVVNKLRRTNARTLEVRGFNLADVSSTLRAIAYCGPGPAPTEHVAEIFIDESATSVTPVKATCPAGKKLIFGGFHGQFPGGSADGAVLPFGLLARQSKEWIVRGFNPGSSGFLRAIAYCRA